MKEEFVEFGILTKEDVEKIEYITKRKFISKDKERVIEDLFKVAEHFAMIKENIKLDGFGALGQKDEDLFTKSYVILKYLIDEKDNKGEK